MTEGADREAETVSAPETATTVERNEDARVAQSATAAAAPPPHAVAIGDVLGGRYRVVHTIGHGGMGVVYAAEHISIGKRVAVKVLGPELSHREGVVERFMQEARAASSIEHPHIVDITDFGFVRDGVPFFVMEYLDGRTLAQTIADRGRLPWALVRRIMAQLCTALQAAHDKGVIHRDIKPDNIILIEHGAERNFVKVLDFGIAKITSDADKNLTRTGTVMGTAAYMSPEQAQSLPVDARTDIYAAGIIAYEMLTGRVPFDAGGFVGVLTKHVSERVPSMRARAPEAKISDAVERVVSRALSKDKRQRYTSAAEFAEALRALGERGGRFPARAARRGWTGVGLLASAALGATVWMRSGSAPVAAPPNNAGSPSGLPAAAPAPPGPTQPAQRQTGEPKPLPGANVGASSLRTSVTDLPGVHDLGEQIPSGADETILPTPPMSGTGTGTALPSLSDLEAPATDTGAALESDTSDNPGVPSGTTSNVGPADRPPTDPEPANGGSTGTADSDGQLGSNTAERD